MRRITKDITLAIDGEPVSFRLTKPDAFSGMVLLRLLMRLEEKNDHPTLLDLIASLSEESMSAWMRTETPASTALWMTSSSSPLKAGSELWE